MRLDNAFDMRHDKIRPRDLANANARRSVRVKNSMRRLLDFSSRGVRGQPDRLRSRQNFLSDRFWSKPPEASREERKDSRLEPRGIFIYADIFGRKPRARWMQALIIHSWQGKTSMIRRLASSRRVARRNSHAVRAYVRVQTRH